MRKIEEVILEETQERQRVGKVEKFEAFTTEGKEAKKKVLTELRQKIEELDAERKRIIAWPDIKNARVITRVEVSNIYYLAGLEPPPQQEPEE